jgi:hypothetical protein
MFLLLQLALFGLALSASVPFPLVAQDAALDNEVLPMDKCWPLMESVGLSARFPGAVSHAIHSLTLEDLRHYFDPQAQGFLSQALSNTLYLSFTKAFF